MVYNITRSLFFPTPILMRLRSWQEILVLKIIFMILIIAVIYPVSVHMCIVIAV